MPSENQGFSTNEELRQAVRKYIVDNNTGQCPPQEAEEFAQTYGYPINQWASAEEFAQTYGYPIN
jgi:hypothetical protein